MNILKYIIKKICPKGIRNFYNSYKRILKEKQYKTLLEQTREHYKEVEEKIKNRGNAPIRFASYVIFDSTFCGYGLMDLMLSDLQNYIPKIVVVPDVSRGKEHMLEQYNKTKNFFINKYGKEYVLDGYNIETEEFNDFSSDFDIVYVANPYDIMVNKVHTIQYLSTKNVLPIYISYGPNVDQYSYDILIPQIEISLYWKVFADTTISYKDYQKYELIHGKNVVLTGYAKMDDLAKYEQKYNSKKTIIIAPHHTINMPSLPLSNFLNNYDFILELPKKYPEVNFIFRPHPLLITTMINLGYWTQEQADDYIRKLEDMGVKYSYGGDYLKTFAESDALIHDCSSFVMEYLYTGKPCCFFAKKNYKDVFGTLGKACLKYYYLSFNREKICNFIENIVLKENDTLAKERQKFVAEKIALNYPHASKKILSEITL